MSFTEAARIIEKYYPALRPRLAKRIRAEPPAHTIDGAETDRVLPIRYRNLEETVKDTIGRMVEIDGLLQGAVVGQ